MKIHEFGEYNRGSVVLIHGAYMPWELLRSAVDVIARTRHVYAVALPGHDPSAGEEFTSAANISARIAGTLARTGLKHVDMLYGLSLGGTLAARMLADGLLEYGYAVIDGGIMPTGKRGFLESIFGSSPAAPLNITERSRGAVAAVYPPGEFPATVVEKISATLGQMSDETMRRVRGSVNEALFSGEFPRPVCPVEYWFGEREEKARSRDIAFVRSLIPQVKLRRIAGMSHAQYMLTNPEMCAGDLLRRMS